ncbi:MAG: hypothetical protein QXX36_01060 [Candidatus Rehaiarchaeum fermentans]|nr:hypothetical protein [Candidatus Rehaiarchaeum fermentans]
MDLQTITYLIPSLLGMTILIILGISFYYMIEINRKIERLKTSTIIFTLTKSSYYSFVLLFLLNFLYLITFVISYLTNNSIYDTLGTLFYVIGILYFLKNLDKNG